MVAVRRHVGSDVALWWTTDFLTALASYSLVRSMDRRSRNESDASLNATLKTVVLALVHSNLLISVAATSVAVSTVLLADLAVELLPLFIVFAVTLFVYSFNRLTDLAEDERNVPERAAFIRRYGRVLFALGGGLYLLAVGGAIVQGVRGAPALIIPFVVAVLYSAVGLKRVLLVKNLLVGLSWGLIPLGVGVYYDVLLTTEILVMFVFITAMLTIAAVVFDIKDIPGDRAEGIRTVPVVFGPRRTRQFAVVATFLVGVAVAVLVVASVVSPLFSVLLAFVAYVAGYTLFATPERTPLFYGFVIDVEHILLALAVLGVEMLTP